MSKADPDKRDFYKRFPKRKKTEAEKLGEKLEKCIGHVIQVNSVLKEILSHPDQISGDRLKVFVDLVRDTGHIILDEGGEA